MGPIELARRESSYALGVRLPGREALASTEPGVVAPEDLDSDASVAVLHGSFPHPGTVADDARLSPLPTVPFVGGPVCSASLAGAVAAPSLGAWLQSIHSALLSEARRSSATPSTRFAAATRSPPSSGSLSGRSAPVPICPPTSARGLRRRSRSSPSIRPSSGAFSDTCGDAGLKSSDDCANASRNSSMATTGPHSPRSSTSWFKPRQRTFTGPSGRSARRATLTTSSRGSRCRWRRRAQAAHLRRAFEPRRSRAASAASCTSRRGDAERRRLSMGRG